MSYADYRPFQPLQDGAVRIISRQSVREEAEEKAKHSAEVKVK